MKKQVKVCKDNLELMEVIVGSTDQAVRVCQMLFSDRRWNCLSINNSPDYLADLTGGEYMSTGGFKYNCWYWDVSCLYNIQMFLSVIKIQNIIIK